ncbi:hypothetical protein [Haliangium sp.]|uniref:hypothetical protein n=1 Tax=Haliangium sp. TaxID=2663208 RepID=UPI003D0F1807
MTASHPRRAINEAGLALPGLEQAAEPAQHGRAKRARRARRSGNANSHVQPQLEPERVRLSEVTPGDWATLSDGGEVLVAWHSRSVSFVEREGCAPESLPAETEVISVRHRRRQVVDDSPVVDPLVGGAPRG